jgi:hypothetical protein
MTTVETTTNGETTPMWQLLLGIIDRPAATFEAVLARRKWYMWAVPLLIVLLCLGVMMVVRTPYDMEIAQQQLERQLATMPPEQVEAARAGMETFMSFPVRLAMGLVTAVLMLLIGVVVQAAILYFGALVAGGEVDFGPVFTCLFFGAGHLHVRCQACYKRSGVVRAGCYRRFDEGCSGPSIHPFGPAGPVLVVAFVLGGRGPLSGGPIQS